MSASDFESEFEHGTLFLESELEFEFGSVFGSESEQQTRATFIINYGNYYIQIPQTPPRRP